MTTPGDHPTEPDQPHTCEHCSGGEHAGAADPTVAAAENLALAGRRLIPRVALGVLGLALALVLADRSGHDLAATALAFGLGAVAWALAATLGTFLGALLTRRGPHPQIALGQVIAAALTPLLALAIALVTLPLGGRVASASGASLDALATTPALDALLPGGVAAMFGWFLAAAIGELVGVRALRRRIARPDELGARARHEAESLTLASIQRGEFLSLALALGFGAMVIALAWLPWLALVLVPLCAAGAALRGRRRLQASEPQAS